MRNSDFLVLPSRYEGFPGVRLEAFSNSLPVMATRVSGSSEIVDNNTEWLVPVDDVSSLANALEQAYSMDGDALNKIGEVA